MSKTALARARKSLNAGRRRLSRGKIPMAKCVWGGANVIVSTETHGGSYREVITPFALEVSGMFERLRNAFARLLDGCSKFEFYGRLELAANSSIRAGGGVIPICNAMLDEAETMLSEMEASRFECLPIAMGIEIAREASGVHA